MITASQIMWVKIVGGILILIATTGFGFHNWILNNKLGNLSAQYEELTAQRDRLYDSYKRFYLEAMEAIIHSVKTDMMILSSSNKKLKKEIAMSGQTMLRVHKKALLGLAAAAGGEHYMEKIGREIRNATTIPNMVDTRDRIFNKLFDRIDTIQKEKDAIFNERTMQAKEIDRFYLFYVVMQVLGIFLILYGEFIEKRKNIAVHV